MTNDFPRVAVGNVDWYLRPGHSMEELGFIPMWLTPGRGTAVEQLDRAYQHGGGWWKFEGFDLNRADFSLNYPGDPPIRPIAYAYIGNEIVAVYPHDWVAVIRKDSFEVARMD